MFLIVILMQKELKANAEISMGTEITSEDIISISALAEQVVSLSEYRIQVGMIRGVFNSTTLKKDA